MMNMYEYILTNKKTGEAGYAFGYSMKNAFERCGLDMNEWTIDFVEYVD